MAARHEIDSKLKLFDIDKLESDHVLDECEVVRATGGEFRKHKVTDLEAPGDSWSLAAGAASHLR